MQTRWLPGCNDCRTLNLKRTRGVSNSISLVNCEDPDNAHFISFCTVCLVKKRASEKAIIILSLSLP